MIYEADEQQNQPSPQSTNDLSVDNAKVASVEYPLPNESIAARGFWAGIIAGVVMVTLMWIFSMAFGHYTLPQLIDPIIVKLLPGQAFEQGIQTFGQAGHAFEIIAIVIGIVLAGGLFGLLYARLVGRRTAEDAATNPQTSGPTVPALLGGAIFAVVLYAIIYGGLLPLLEKVITSDAQTYRGVGVFGSNIPNSSLTQEGWLGFVLMSLASLLAFGLTLGGVFDRDVRDTTRVWHNKQAASNTMALPSRRRALRQIAGVAAVAVAGVAGYNYVGARGGVGLGLAGTDNANLGGGAPGGSEGSPVAAVPLDTPEPNSLPQGADLGATPVATPAAGEPTPVANLDISGLPPLVTPTRDFYHVSKNSSDPKVPKEGWKLTVEGLVDKPYTLTYDELLAQPSLYRYLNLSCISNPIGGNLIGSAKWKGTPLKGLLDKAGVQAGAKRVVFLCADDYTDSISIEVALHDYNLLAWEMNGATLPDDHGFPARLLIPGIYGMKNTKWLKTIRVIDDPNYKGFWQSNGWDNPAPTRTMSTFYLPRRDQHSQGMLKVGVPNLVGGVAYAGDRGISEVEVSTDGGQTWATASLRPPLSRFAWLHWTYNWTPQQPGKFTLKVRATDGTGKLQLDQVKEAYPAGAEAYDTITAEVA